MPDKIAKFIQSLDQKTRLRLKQKLVDLEKEPFSTGKDIKKLKNTDNTYRLRMGKIRIIYQVIGKEIEILDIDYRGNIY